jgi:hypothetical protein
MSATKLLLAGLLTCVTAVPALAQDFRPYRYPNRDRDRWQYEPRDRRDLHRDYPPEVRPSYPPAWQQPPVAQQPADTRHVWAYSGYGGGNFHRTQGTQWVQEGYGGPFNYVETARTPDYVELYDQQRGVYVRLFNDQFMHRPNGQADFSPILPGGWQQ